jgi:hypothetical protein
MIDAKRIAEIRGQAHNFSFLTHAELLQLVECYEAARAWIEATRRYGATTFKSGLVLKHGAEMELARRKLLALFPEAGNG